MVKAEKTEKENGKIDRDELKAALAKEQQERIEQAKVELEALCKKLKVNIVPQAILTQGSVTMSLSIVPTE